MAGTVRPDGGADAKPAGAGAYPAAHASPDHCDHRGLPLALINEEGQVEWSADYDGWDTLLSENNPHGLVQVSPPNYWGSGY